MASRRYPLEPLVAVRRQKVERRLGELGQAATKRGKERVLAEAAAARHTAARKDAKSARESERRELERGTLTARDLVQGELHAVAVAARMAGLARAEATAAERLDRAQAAEAKAKLALGRARAEREAVLRHRERFHAELAKKQENEQEDAALDRFTATRRGARRG